MMLKLGVLGVVVRMTRNERSISSLKRIKTGMRSTFSNERLPYFALMHIHSDVTVGSQEMVDMFTKQTPQADEQALSIAHESTKPFIYDLGHYNAYLYISKVSHRNLNTINETFYSLRTINVKTINVTAVGSDIRLQLSVTSNGD